MIMNCAYSFHADPQVRSVELKLRRAAVDAYARGVVPLRVVAKFLDQDDGPDGGSARARKKRSELLRVEFLQVLMELGFSLLSDSIDAVEGDTNDCNNDGGEVRPRVATRLNDHVYARQLERLACYKRHVEDKTTTAAQTQLVRAVTKTKRQQQARLAQPQQAAAAASLQRFADDKHQLLRVLSHYRDGQKKALVYALLRDHVTTTVTLWPHFAMLVFLELPFRNPYTHHERFRLEVVLPPGAVDASLLDVSIVRSDAEWAFYRQTLPLAYGAESVESQQQQPVEKEMIDDHNEVVLDGHDRLHVPVRLRWLGRTTSASKATPLSADQRWSDESGVQVSVAVRSCTHGHTVALFKLQLQPRASVCHRVLRFSHPAGSIWRWQLQCPRDKFFVCLDPRVAVTTSSQSQSQGGSGVVALKCRIGEYPSLEEFYVVLYNDQYYATIYQVWLVRIQAKLRLDVHTVLGQRVTCELVVRGDGASNKIKRRHVRCFTTLARARDVQFQPAHVFQLVPHAFNRIELAFCATERESAQCGRVLVNLVDVETHELVGAWVVRVALALPAITKTYTLTLPRGQPAQKKIAYANPWDEEQTIVLRSSAPSQLAPRDAVLQIPSRGTAFLRLGFGAVAHPMRNDVYLFINDQLTDQNEECLLFQLKYE